MNGKEIATTTIKQLGGHGRLQAMVGAHDFVYDNKGTLTFKFRGCRKHNFVAVEYDRGADAYNVSFGKITKNFDLVQGPVFRDIYCDQLIPVFEETTGLFLSLGPARRWFE